MPKYVGFSPYFFFLFLRGRKYSIVRQKRRKRALIQTRPGKSCIIPPPPLLLSFLDIKGLCREMKKSFSLLSFSLLVPDKGNFQGSSASKFRAGGKVFQLDDFSSFFLQQQRAAREEEEEEGEKFSESMKVPPPLFPTISFPFESWRKEEEEDR